MMLLSQRLDQNLAALKLPTSTARDLLAFLHSGEVLRKGLSRLMEAAAIVWLLLGSLAWLASWPGIYHEFERWGLVKAFFAQLVALTTILLLVRITWLRAEQLARQPADDFTVLRSAALLARWVGDFTLIWVVGSGVSSLLQPLGPTLSSLAAGVSPALGRSVSGGAAQMLLVSAPLTLFFVQLALAAFLACYIFANTIDLGLAIEFNTRADRAGRTPSHV